MSAPANGPRLRDRIRLLDVLRGFALLGILAMNVQSFSMPSAAYVNPAAYGSLRGADGAVWAAGYLLCDLKFISLFSMLFGAGILVSTGAWGAGPERPRAFHLRRMGALLGFGLLHAFLLWYGDILVAYALCGLAVYPLRHLAAGRKLKIAAVLLAMPTVLALAVHATALLVPSLGVREMLEQAWGRGDLVTRELSAFRGSWTQAFGANARLALASIAGEFPIFYARRAGGCMLLGMALLERGLLAGKAGTAAYARLARLGFGVGLPVVGLAAALHFATGWQPMLSYFVIGQLNGLGSIGVALGWLGLVGWIVDRVYLRSVADAIAGLGRMAFTGYLLQSFAGTLVFRGHGLGLFGSVRRSGQAAFVIAVWLAEVALAAAWLRVFAFGPFEWAWRCLSYARLVPMLRSSGPDAAVT